MVTWLGELSRIAAVGTTMLLGGLLTAALLRMSIGFDSDERCSICASRATAVRKLETVALRHPVVPVGNGFGG